jgi:hypothetical protein
MVIPLKKYFDFLIAPISITSDYGLGNNDGYL